MHTSCVQYFHMTSVLTTLWPLHGPCDTEWFRVRERVIHKRVFFVLFFVFVFLLFCFRVFKREYLFLRKPNTIIEKYTLNIS